MEGGIGVNRVAAASIGPRAQIGARRSWYGGDDDARLLGRAGRSAVQ